MNRRRVAVTGLGTVNPTGKSVAESWDHIRNGMSGIGEITLFDTTDFKTKVAGEVKEFDPFERIDKKTAKRMARFAQFALCAADELLPAVRTKPSTASRYPSRQPS